MIAIVVDRYEQALPYLEHAAPLGERYVVVMAPQDVPEVLTGAAYVGGSVEVLELVQQALARAPGDAGGPSAPDAANR